MPSALRTFDLDVEKPSSKSDPRAKLKNTISRELTALLRHRAPDESFPMRDDGFVPLKAVLNLNNKLRKADLQLVKEIVAENDKKRLELVQDPAGEYLIRAVQGHTVKVLDEDKLMTPINDPRQLEGVTIVHGTDDVAWGFIRKTGLNKMARNHIHFARGYPGDKEVISGMRTTCSVFVELDVPFALHNGIKLLESKNGVILSPGVNGAINPVYFKQVLQRDPTTGQRVKVFGNEDLNALKPEFMYRYLFVLDFEANCLDGQVIDPQEILEFPVVVVDTHQNCILADKTFHYYVRPDVHPVTAFCTQLTGITQAVVEAKGLPLTEVLSRFHAWVAEHKFDLNDCCFVTCGLWDLKTCLRNEALFRKIDLPPFFKRFINVKEVFAVKYRFGKPKFGMPDMLTELGIELSGRHHSGIDDASNIAKIVLQMCREQRLITRDFTRLVA